MLKALHFIEQLGDYGGTPIKLLTFVRYGSRSEVTHRFVTMKQGALDDSFRAAGAEVFACGTTDPATLFHVFRNQIRVWTPGIVCTHFTRSLLTGALAAAVSGVKYAHHEHGPADLDAQDQGLRRRALRVAKRLALRRAAGIVANSRYTANTISSVFGAKAATMRVLHNPVAKRPRATDADGSRNSQTGTTFEVGHIGGLVEWRDQLTLVSAIGELRSRGVDARLTIVGDGPMKARLGAAIETMRLEPFVRWFGYRGDVGDILATFDVYVNPALAEGFGIAVVEAMLAGLPVVLSSAGAHPELVDDGTSGFLYPAGDGAALASVLARLHASPRLRRDVGEKAAVDAAARFDPAKVASNYSGILTEFAGGDAPPTATEK